MDERQVPHIDQDVTMSIFKKFADVEEVDESVAKYVMLSTEAFWEYLINGWESYAAHAGRQHLEKSDIQLHMLRIGLAKNSNEFNALVTSHLPLDLVVDVVDIAQAKNDKKVGERRRRKTINFTAVSPKSKDLERRRWHTINVKGVSPKPKDLNTAVTSGGQAFAKRRLFSTFCKEKSTLK